MTDAFDLDHKPWAADSRFTEIAFVLSEQLRIDSRVSFNTYCQDACRLWNAEFEDGIGTTSEKFADLLRRIERGGDEIIQTPWGGVLVTLHEHPQVEKYLVVQKGGYLALEKHAEKDEHLEVQEGAGLILYRRADDPILTIQVLMPGDQFHLEPGREHCMIGTENVLIFERSIDPKGMDQDLIFLYEPD